MDLDLGQLRAMAAVVAEGTFEAAARALHVTPSAVSQRIRALETAAGQVLLVRSKPARPTEAGRAVLRLARQVELLGAETAQVLGEREGEPAAAPVVPIAVNADSMATWFLPALAPLAGEFCFDLVREDQERTGELLREGSVMAAVTTRADAVPGCSVTPLGRVRYRPVATPEFAGRWFPDGIDPGALARAPVVVYDRDDDLQGTWLRRRARRVVHPPTHHVPATADYARAVLLGFGWGMLLDEQAEDPLRRGVVLELDPAGALRVPLHWQRWKLASGTLDRVTDAVVGAARRVLAE